MSESREHRARTLEFFNGLGGFADGGREYVTILGPGPVDAGAVVQRHRQPVVRVPGLRVGLGLHLVGEQPREPAHAVVERSRQPTRRARRSTSATTRPASCGARRPCRSAARSRPTSPVTAPGTAGSSTSTTASQLDLVQFVPLDDPLKVSAADHREPLRPHAAPVGHRLRRVGAGHLAGRRRATHRHRARPGDASAPGAQPVEHRSSAAGSRSSTSAAGRRHGPPTGPSSSAATVARTARRARPRTPAREAPRRRPGPVRRAPDRASSSPTARGPQVVVLLGRGGRRGGRRPS